MLCMGRQVRCHQCIGSLGRWLYWLPYPQARYLPQLLQRFSLPIVRLVILAACVVHFQWPAVLSISGIHCVRCDVGCPWRGSRALLRIWASGWGSVCVGNRPWNRLRAPWLLCRTALSSLARSLFSSPPSLPPSLALSFFLRA